MGTVEMFTPSDPVLSPGNNSSDVNTLYVETFVVTGAKNWISPQRPTLGKWVGEYRSLKWNIIKPFKLVVMRTVVM